MKRPSLFRYAEALRANDPEKMTEAIANHRLEISEKEKELNRARKLNLFSQRIKHQAENIVAAQTVFSLAETIKDKRLKKEIRHTGEIDLADPLGKIVMCKIFSRDGRLCYTFGFGDTNVNFSDSVVNSCVYDTPDIFAFAGGPTKRFGDVESMACALESVQSLEVINAIAQSRTD